MRIDIELIKQQTDIRQLAARFTTLTGAHSQAGPCPRCGGKNRFVAYADKFLCRQCHQSYGDCFEFAAWLNDFDLATRTGLQAAADWLTNGNAPMLAEAAPTARTTPAPRPLLTPPGELWQARAAAFVAWSQEQLWQPAGRAGLDYLLGRGLTEATIKAAGLGYNPQDYNEAAARWGIESGRDSVWLPGPGVVIPWLVDGSLHRVNIRLLTPRQVNGSETKYIGPAGWAGANPLFNADSITPHKPVLLVEGELCALTAQQEAGDLLTAAATGAKDAAQAGRWIARLAAAPLVLLAFDAEPGKGDAAAAKWAQLLPRNSRRWRPLLKDVNDMHRVGLSVRSWLAAALPAESGRDSTPAPGPHRPESPPDSGSPAAPFKVMLWPPTTPPEGLPRFTRLADGRLRTEYQTETEFVDSVTALALLKDAAELDGVIRGVV